MREKLAALLELVGVFITGTLVARLLYSPKGLRDLTQAPDFLALAGSTAASLLLRYGLILGLAFAIGWWHRRRRLADYGVTRAGMPLREHLVIGIVLFAVGGILPRFIVAFRDYLGTSPRHWDLIETQPSLAYWIYMAVGSFVMVAILEELFARGYVQTRLGEDFGAPAAIVMTALMFTLSHTQYFLASAVGIGMVLSLLFASLIGGYVRHRYGTLIPVIVAHALGNVPYRGWVQYAVLIAAVIVIVIARKAIAVHLRDAFKLIARREVLAPAGIVALMVFVVLAIAAISRAALLPAGIAALGAAIALERRNRADQKEYTTRV